MATKAEKVTKAAKVKTTFATFLAFLTFVAGAAGQPAAPERTLSLEESIRLALLNDGRFLGAEQEIKIAEQRVKEARFLFYPEIGLAAIGTKFEADRPFVLGPQFNSLYLTPSATSKDERLYSGRAYFQQTLYNGGRGVSTLNLAKAGLKQARARYDAARLDVRLNTQRVFHEYLFAQEKSRVVRGRLAEAAEALGKDPQGPWARLEAEAMLEDLRALDAELNLSRERARLEYLKSLNLELDTSVQVSGDLKTKPLAADLGKLSVWAIELRPELQSEAYQAQMDAIAVNLSLARRLPSLVFGMDYEYVGSDFPLRQKNWDAVIGLRLPISYDFFSQIQQRRAEQRQGQIKRAELQDRVQLELRQAWQSLEFWQGEWERREQSHKRAAGLHADARKAAGSGLEKARALGALARIELRRLEAVKEHLLAKAALERAVGRALE